MNTSPSVSFIPGLPAFPPLPVLDIPAPRLPRRTPLRCPDKPLGEVPAGIHFEGGSVSVGHGPGVKNNEGTAGDRGTGAPDSNLTEIDATEEPAGRKPQRPKDAQASGKDGLLPGVDKGPAQPR
ncbi:MAG: hypothetical protein EOP36_02905 [Rubrivivax sp.]|nr:MAG: hypothetical protein EOP36_02905 [Rubrivivax sp.]